VNKIVADVHSKRVDVNFNAALQTPVPTTEEPMKGKN
jgi:hypothetical protein